MFLKLSCFRGLKTWTHVEEYHHFDSYVESEISQTIICWYFNHAGSLCSKKRVFTDYFTKYDLMSGYVKGCCYYYYCFVIYWLLCPGVWSDPGSSHSGWKAGPVRSCSWRDILHTGIRHMVSITVKLYSAIAAGKQVRSDHVPGEIFYTPVSGTW